MNRSTDPRMYARGRAQPPRRAPPGRSAPPPPGRGFVPPRGGAPLMNRMPPERGMMMHRGAPYRAPMFDMRGGRPPFHRGPLHSMPPPLPPPGSGRPPAQPQLLRPPLRGMPQRIPQRLPPPPPPPGARWSSAPIRPPHVPPPVIHSQMPPQIRPPMQQAAIPLQPPHVQQTTGNPPPPQLTTMTTVQPATTNHPASLPVNNDPATAWTEHSAPNGMKYYYNSVTKESTYFKPDILKEKTSKWTEYTDASTGRKYYSDGTTTTWEKPADFSQSSQTTTSETTMTQEEEETPAQEPARKKKKSTSKETEFGSKQEAIAAFKGLLMAKDVSPTSKWHEVAKVCGSDSRWQSCMDVLTTGECKQALAEYQTKRSNELKALERQERVRAKEVFTQLLAENLPKLKGSTLDLKFQDVRDDLARDDRFHAVVDEPTRESLFLDFCEEFRKHEERKKRSKKREAKERFVSLLKEKYEDGSLTYATTWDSFKSSLTDDDRNDERFVVLPERSDDDRQLYFSDFVIELQKLEDDKRRRIREARERAESEQREAFREHLSQLAVNGKLLPASRWRNVEELIVSHPSYGPVHAQDREAPRELFEDFANEWNTTYRKERTFLSQLVYPSPTSDAFVKAESTFEEFVERLLEKSKESPETYATTREIVNSSTPVSSARLYFNELSLRARGLSAPSFVRRGSALRRNAGSDSSEDEGEIVEDGEVAEMLKS